MFLYVILIFVAQISYCAASYTCIPTYAVCIIGISLPTLLFLTIALGVYGYRLKREQGSEESVYEVNRNASMFQYERQVSEHSQRILCGTKMEDETMQLDTNNEYVSNGCIRDENYSEASVEAPNIIKIQTKVPIIPGFKKEHIDAICEAVNSLKERTSLSDLDKIVNDAKEEAKKKDKTLNISASTPALDFNNHLSSPVPVKKVKKPAGFDADSKESRLRDEMVARLNHEKIQTNENENEINFVVNDEEKNSAEHKKNNLNFDQDEMNLKLIHHEMMTKTIRDELKSKLNLCKINKKSQPKSSQSKDEIEPSVIETVQDDIYNLPPPPKVQDELYDVLPSPKRHSVTSSFPSSLTLENELYNLPPSPKPDIKLDNLPSSPNLCNETNYRMYDFPPSSKRNDETNYDTQPSAEPHNEVYETVPTTRNKNRVVSDGNETGYLLPLSDDASADESQYSNAKTPPNQNSL